VGEVKMPTIERKSLMNGWIALFSGIIELAILILTAFLIEGADPSVGGQILSNLSVGIILVAIIVGIPLILIGAVILFRATKFNDRLEDLAMTEAYERQGGVKQTTPAGQSGSIEQGATLHCSSCGKTVSQGPYCNYCGAKIGKRDLQ